MSENFESNYFTQFPLDIRGISRILDFEHKEKFVRNEFVVRWATQTEQKCSKYCYFSFCRTYHKTDSDIKIHRKLLSLVGRTALKHINQRRSFFYINNKGSFILRVTVSHVHRFFEKRKKSNDGWNTWIVQCTEQKRSFQKRFKILRIMLIAHEQFLNRSDEWTWKKRTERTCFSKVLKNHIFFYWTNDFIERTFLLNDRSVRKRTK